jgi:hypothetical protein
MLFVTYWEVNGEMPVEERNEIARTLTREQQFPPEGVELVRYDGTPDGLGIGLVEADDYEAVNNARNMWRTAVGDTAFFEETRTAPAAPAEDVIARQTAMLEESSMR